MSDQVIGFLLILGAIGVALLVLGINWYQFRRDLKDLGETAIGLVVKSDPYSNHRKVKFVTGSGSIRRTSAGAKDEFGGRVRVYDPEKPWRATTVRLLNSRKHDVLPWFVMALGMVLLLLSFGLAIANAF